jgi:uncharacterized membrane protein
MGNIYIEGGNYTRPSRTHTLHSLLVSIKSTPNRYQLLHPTHPPYAATQPTFDLSILLLAKQASNYCGTCPLVPYPAARTILLLHIISVRPSKQPLMVRTFLKVYMELGSYFLFLQEHIKDIIIILSCICVYKDVNVE